jgi:hypothetical protein
MTGDKPKDSQSAEASHIVQASFEERLRVASAQRAKVLAAKAAAEAEADASADGAPVRARRYIKPGSRARLDTLTASPDITSSEAAEFADFVDSFEPRSERAADLLPRLADARADVQMSKAPDDPDKLVSRLMLLSAFLVGAAAGCIGTIIWVKAVTLPNIL